MLDYIFGRILFIVTTQLPGTFGWWKGALKPMETRDFLVKVNLGLECSSSDVAQPLGLSQ